MTDTTNDKAKQFGPGPWVDEPDRVEFRAFGLPCLVLRSQLMGNLCGYVAVPPGHPLHGVDCEAAQAAAKLYVHGGLTYSSACADDICHVPAPGESDDVWWFGFDAAHGGDLTPMISAYGATFGEYRDLDYMKEETVALAALLSFAARELPP